MIKKFSLILIAFLCFVSIGFGQTTVCFDFSTGYSDGTTFSNQSLDANIRFTTYQNNGSALTRIWSDQLRCYQSATKGGGFIIDALNGVTITDVVITASGSTGPAEYIIDGGTPASLSASSIYSITGLSATTNVEFYQKDGSSSNRIYIDEFCVTYTSGVSTNTVTVTQSTGGVISPGTTSVPDNGSQSFTATPDSCHTFASWTIDGTPNTSTVNPYTFTNVTTDHNITAVYNSITHTIVSVAGANGSISPNGTSTVNCGDDLTYTFTPDSGYAVQDVLVDGVSVGAVTSYDFTNINDNHTISVTFEVYIGPCASESFDNSNATGSYNDSSFTGDNSVTWTYTESRDENGDANGSGIDGNALMLRGSSYNSKIISSTVANGIENFSVKLYKGFTGSGNRQVELFVNGISQGTSTPFDDYSEHLFTVSGINISGNIVVEIRAITDKQVIIDDIEWTCYSSCMPPADPSGAISGATPVCSANTSLSFSGTAPANVVYYWQTISMGESQSDNAAVNLTVSTSGNYYVRAYDTIEGCWSDGETGPFNVIVTASTPNIISQPSNISAGVGGTASFVVTATDAVSYQWYVSTNGGSTWTPTGSNGNTLSVSNTQLSQDGYQYQVVVSNACGNTISNIAILSVTTTTIFNPGELIFVGYDGQINGSGSEDEFLIATLVDIVPGTEFSLVNSRYEAGAPANVRTQKWGGGSDDPSSPPFETKIQYNGSSSIPAGSVLRFEVTNSNSFIVFVGVVEGTTETTMTSDFTANVVYSGSYANISTSGDDQLYLMQGDFIFDGTNTSNEANYTFNGTLLHGITIGTTWVPLTNACSGSSSTRESRLPPELRCFNVESTSSIRGYYENDKEHGLATIREIVNNVSDDSANWTIGSYNFDPTDNTASSGGKTFLISPNNPSGQWVGDVDNNWFNCANWEGLAVPKATTNVVVDNSATYNAKVDYTAAYSDEFNDTAYCNNLTINGNVVDLSGNSLNVLEIHGNFLLDGSGILDMDNGGSEDGTIYLYGNWTNSIGQNYFEEGNGTVVFTGSTSDIQRINYGGPPTPPAFQTEEFFNVILNNNFNTYESNNLHVNGDLTINADKILTVVSNDYVYVNNKVTVASTGTFHIQNNGSLVQQGNGTNANVGKISMERTASSLELLDYVYWSSPINEFNSNNIFSTTSHIYKWNTTAMNGNGGQGTWENAVNEPMAVGSGYIARVPSTLSGNTFTANFNASTDIAGRPNNGNIYVPISKGSNLGVGNSSGNPGATIISIYDDNWNLVGNPYPSAISAYEFLSTNTNIDGFVCLWRHQTQPTSNIDPFYDDFADGSNYTSSDYIYYNLTGESIPPGYTNHDVETDDKFIGAGQGFLVNMLESASNPNVEFNNNMRNILHNNSQFYRTGTIDKHRIWLNLYNSNFTAINTILLGYVEGATMERDRMYDAVTNAVSTKIYSLIEDEKFIIQGRALPFEITDHIPLGLAVFTAGNYYIALSDVDGLFETENQVIYLKDNFLNLTFNISEDPYSFFTEAGEFNDRFEIVFQTTSLSIDDTILSPSDLTIIELPDGSVKFKVSKDSSISKIEIIDVLGKTLYNLEGSSSEEVYFLPQLSQAVYFARVTLDNGQVLTKKAIKN